MSEAVSWIIRGFTFSNHLFEMLVLETSGYRFTEAVYEAASQSLSKLKIYGVPEAVKTILARNHKIS